MSEPSYDKIIDKDEIAERLHGFPYGRLSAWGKAQVDHIHSAMTKVDAPHTQTVTNEEPMRRRLAQTELENEALRQELFEATEENADLKAELEELRRQWNTPAT